MKVYQLIYTCAEHCINDIDYGFIDKRGYGVYSYTKGLPKDDINDCVKYMNYRLPSVMDEEAEATVMQPPPQGGSYPTVYRTFKMTSGKYACVQSTFLGLDINGENRNFLSHAFIIDCEEDAVIPKLACFYNSPSFLCDLTDEMKSRTEVEYLPLLDEIKINSELLSKLGAFISEHKREMSYLMVELLDMLSSNDKKHMMLASEDELAVSYLIALKFIMPNALAAKFGVSTYNVNIPSDKQQRIRLHATKSDYNNITDELIDIHPSCVYVDVDKLETADYETICLVELDNSGRARLFEKLPFEYPEQLNVWIKTYQEKYVNELAINLDELRDNCGNSVYASRVKEIFEDIDSPLYDAYRLDILISISKNVRLVTDIKLPLLTKFVYEGFKAIAEGDDVNLEGALIDDEVSREIYRHMGEYMQFVTDGKIETKNAMLMVRFFALLKQSLGIPTWKEFFGNNTGFICEFVEAAAQVIINDTQPVTFTPPAVWTKEELAEIVAYFDASTKDARLRRACRKYILANSDIKWGVFGIVLRKAKRSPEEAALDIKQVQSLLASVGYVPFQKSSYQDLRFRVINDINSQENPLLVERVIYAFYSWQAKDKQLAENKVSAERLSELILELRKTEPRAYEFMFPKLGIEILESPGNFHEIIINADTMVDGFWDWFMLSYLRITDDEKFYTYQRVYDASKPYLSKSITSKIDRII